MKNSKKILIIILIIIIISIIFIAFLQYDKKDEGVVNNYIPEEEISESQSRQTIITLYFIGKDTGEIMPEARLIDANKLIKNPYEELIKLLIEGPKNEKLNSIIPNNVKLNLIKIENKCVIIDFSQEFLGVLEDENNKYKAINTIVNTLTELNEVETIKILIEGKENEKINELYSRIK